MGTEREIKMPKGSKTCSNCGHNCGPRSFVCVKCGSPFTFKDGSKPTQSDIKLSIERAKIKNQIINEVEQNDNITVCRREITEYFKYINPTDREVSLYGKNVLILESLCGKYRLRIYNRFMGVPTRTIHGHLDLDYNEKYYMLCKYQPNDFLALVKRFRSATKVIEYHEAVIKGEREEVLYKPQNERKTRGERALRKRKRKFKLQK